MAGTVGTLPADLLPVEDPAVGETSWPFNEGPGADPGEAGWTRMARHFACHGVIGDPNGATLQVYGDSTGMSVKVMPGMAWVRGHMYYLDATKVLTITANGTGSVRVDRVVLELDPATDAVTAIVVPGTAGAGAPTLVQTDVGKWQLPLAKVTVASGAVTIAASAVTNDRVGQGVDVHPVLSLSQLTNPRRGHIAYVIPADRAYLWNGAQWRELQFVPSWVSYTPSWAKAVFGTGNVRRARYLRDGPTCRVVASMEWGTGGSFNTTDPVTVSLPFPALNFGSANGAMRWIGSGMYRAGTAGHAVSVVPQIVPGGTTALVFALLDVTGAGTELVSPNNLTAPTANAWMSIDIEYEIAV